MNKKNVIITGYAAFLGLFLLAILFYLQRTAFVDLSFHLFYLLKDQDLCIQNYRIGAAFTQSFPIVGAYLGFSLKAIAILYSCSFIVLYISTFSCILFIFKNTKLAYIYLLFCILMTTHTFFWAQSELPQGVAFLFLYIGLLFNFDIEQMYSSKFKIIGLFALLIVVVFTHPLLIFPFVFLHVFFFINKMLKRKLLFTSFFLYGFILSLKVLFFSTPYDRGSMSGVKNFVSHFPNYFDTISFKHFWQYLIHEYYLLLLLFIITFLFLVYTKKWLNLGLMLISTIGYLTLINVSYINGSEQFYLENQYLLLVIFVALPFIYLVMPIVSNTRWSWFFSIVLLISLFSRIWIIEPVYSSRLNLIREIVTQMKNKNLSKVVLVNENIPLDKLLMTWGGTYESWLVSTLEQEQTRTFVVETLEHQFDYTLLNPLVWTTHFGDFKINTLNQSFYKLDTLNVYKRMNYNELMN